MNYKGEEFLLKKNLDIVLKYKINKDIVVSRKPS